MMKQHHNQQQQQQQTMNGVHGGQSPSETKWWYKGPDGETYGPYKSHDMLTWGKSGYFNDSLPVKTENDDMFHPIGDWTIVMGGANPFLNASVPAFHILVHGAQQQQQYLLQYPPGLPAPAAPFNTAAPPSNGGGPGGRYGGPYLPNNGGGPPPQAGVAAVAAMAANLHLGGGGGGGAHMILHPMHHLSVQGGPLSQPPSEPNDGANSSNSHTPDSAEPDFRALHMMNASVNSMNATMGSMAMPPPVPSMTMHNRVQFGYGMQPPMHPQQQQQQQQQQHQQSSQQQPQQHNMMGGGGGGGVALVGSPAMHTSNGQLQYTRVTSTQDAPWNGKRDIAVDASQRVPQRTTIATQTLPVIIGSKDASRLLSELTGCSIVIT